MEVPSVIVLPVTDEIVEIGDVLDSVFVRFTGPVAVKVSVVEVGPLRVVVPVAVSVDV